MNPVELRNKFKSEAQNLGTSIEYTLNGQFFEIGRITDLIYHKLLDNHRIFLIGNGGSAADADHIAAEFQIRLKSNRKALGVMALTTSPASLTAAGNDFGFDSVFSRQLEACANSGDLVIAFSTSGTSSNIVEALNGRDDLTYVLVHGNDLTIPRKDNLYPKVSEFLRIQSNDTARIQETYKFIFHVICEEVESRIVNL